MKNAIIETCKKNKSTSAEIKAQLDVPITTRLIRQIINQSGKVTWLKRYKNPALKDHHKIARLELTKKHMHWQSKWQNIIFSDEKKFNLDGPDGYQFYWHDLSKDVEVRMSRNFGRGSLMVWGAFGYNEKSPICWISTKIHAERYIELLDNVLVDFAEKQNENFIFQHDNASIHSAKATKNWLHCNDIEVLNWPAISPDLNPIENLWGIIARRVYHKGRQFTAVEELKQAIRETWANIPLTELQNLIDSMPNRTYEVINKNGAATHY